MELKWSPRSERELTQIRDYIAQDSPFYARQFIERIILAAERLITLPRSGRTVPEAGNLDDIREIILQGYRIIYRIRNESLLEIVTVVHGSRDLGRIESPPWGSAG